MNINSFECSPEYGHRIEYHSTIDPSIVGDMIKYCEEHEAGDIEKIEIMSGNDVTTYTIFMAGYDTEK